MTWPTIELSSVAQLAKRMENLDPTKRYRQIGVRLWGEGAYERETITGAETQYQSFTSLKTDDIIVNKIWARNGSVSVVDEELSGCYGSPEFPIYEIDKSRLLPRFFYWFTKTKMLWDQCDLQSRGTSGQNRLRPEKFLKIKIPLPPFGQQISIARQLDDIQAKLQDRLSTLEEIERDTESMLQNALFEIVDGAEYRPLTEVAPLVRRPVQVELDREYPQLGARSFGRGLFHKPPMVGAAVSWEKLFWIHEGDLVFSNIKAWEGAFGVASAKDHLRVGSHRYLTCVVKPDVATPNFIWFYLQSRDGLLKVDQASPGSADRNRTLGQKALEAITVPVPRIEAQRQFDKLCAYIDEIRDIRASTAKDAQALLPAMLHDIFERNAIVHTEATEPYGNVVSLPRALPLSIDTPFKEAVLVSAIIKAFHEEGGQPLGNFRLQKAVYFARRFMGERSLDQQYLRKAAGPYNPTMRYSGGAKIALEKNWIAAATGNFGPGHSPGSAFDDASAWIENYQFAKTAAWVRDKFKFKQNDIWELLATVDYVMLALEYQGAAPNPANVLEYIRGDAEWHPKVERLHLGQVTIKNAMAELQSLFADGGGTDARNSEGTNGPGG
ncbi:restriction endonuclease subunit S [Mesorhizobium australicum]|uniref:restriction endonuclease subunit S n=1 Tax=Mesorhizobium australicum TaxID=536018 RepID=UPI003337EBBC